MCDKMDGYGVELEHDGGIPLDPLILITNDDGIHSPGLHAAALALAPLGDLLIAAPLHQHSGAGRSFPNTTSRQIHPQEIALAGEPVTAFAVDGSPAQAVVYALATLAPRLPDLCVVGINYGENLGSGITTSGTVGAALEAASAGIPTLAVSLQTRCQFHHTHSPEIDFEVAAHFVQFFARRLLSPQVMLPFDVDLLKVDVPDDATPDTPWRVTRVSRQPYFELVLPPDGAHGDDALDYGVRAEWPELEPDSDIYALVRDRVVSVSPVSLDLSSRTDRAAVASLLRGDR